MYYLLAAILFITLFFALAKLLKSILKSSLVAIGVLLFVYLAYVFINSANEPVRILNRIEVDNFQIEILEKPKPKELHGSWEYL